MTEDIDLVLDLRDFFFFSFFSRFPLDDSTESSVSRRGAKSRLSMLMDVGREGFVLFVAVEVERLRGLGGESLMWICPGAGSRCSGQQMSTSGLKYWRTGPSCDFELCRLRGLVAPSSVKTTLGPSDFGIFSGDGGGGGALFLADTDLGDALLLWRSSLNSSTNELSVRSGERGASNLSPRREVLRATDEEDEEELRGR